MLNATGKVEGSTTLRYTSMVICVHDKNSQFIRENE